MSAAEPTGVDPILIAAVEQMLTDAESMRAPDSDQFPSAAWQAALDMGLPLTWLDANLGGAGASCADGFAVAEATGRYAAPIPVAEGLIAAWLLKSAGAHAPSGSMSVACGSPQVTANSGFRLDAADRVSGRAAAVPFGRYVDYFVLVGRRDETTYLVVVKRDDAQLATAQTLGPEPRDSVVLDRVAPVIQVHAALDEVDTAGSGATVRALQMVGVMRRIVELSIAHATTRQQFGRPIAKYQAIQHYLAMMAGELAAATCAANAAAAALSDGVRSASARIAIAAAKIRCARSAAVVSRLAHQIHGAMGFTREYPLHLFTRRLWTWRDDFGSEAWWASRLGEAACEAGPDRLWTLVAGA